MQYGRGRGGRRAPAHRLTAKRDSSDRGTGRRGTLPGGTHAPRAAGGAGVCFQPCFRTIGHIERATEWWPSGRRHTPAKGADGKPSRGFESLPLRHLPPRKRSPDPGCGRIFPLFSRVMRERLSTGSGAGWLGSGLSGPIFSGPDDCASLVNSSQVIEFKEFNILPAERFDFRDSL